MYAVYDCNHIRLFKYQVKDIKAHIPYKSHPCPSP